MNHENSYRLVQDQPQPVGQTWPRVSSRVALRSGEDGYIGGGQGSVTRDVNQLPYRQPHLQPNYVTGGERNRSGGYNTGYTGGAPLKRGVNAIYEGDDHATWDASDTGSFGGVASPGIEELLRHQSEAHRRNQSEAHRRNQSEAHRSEAHRRNQSEAAPSILFETPLSGSTKSTPIHELGRIIQDNDPTVPSYAQPLDSQPLPEDSAIQLDREAGKPELGAVRLNHVDSRGEASRAYPMVFRDAPFLQIPKSNLIIALHGMLKLLGKLHNCQFTKILPTASKTSNFHSTQCRNSDYSVALPPSL